MIQTYSVRVRKAFGFGLEASTQVGFVPSTTILVGGADVRMSILGEHGLPWPWESMHLEALAWFDNHGDHIDAEEVIAPLNLLLRKVIA